MLLSKSITSAIAGVLEMAECVAGTEISGATDECVVFLFFFGGKSSSTSSSEFAEREGPPTGTG